MLSSKFHFQEWGISLYDNNNSYVSYAFQILQLKF